ncbi:MAG: hypothetical protein ACR2H3_15410 [Acidimicrobiales bacterium]
MNTYVKVLLGLGNRGAVENARRVCHHRVTEEARIDAALRRLTVRDFPRSPIVGRPVRRSA